MRARRRAVLAATQHLGLARSAASAGVDGAALARLAARVAVLDAALDGACEGGRAGI